MAKSNEPSMSRRGYLGFALIFGLLSVSAGISYYNFHQLFLSTRDLLHRNEIQNALAHVLSTMKDAETGTRGYVITGDKKFLQPYDAALAQIEPQMDQLRELVAEDPSYQADLESLKQKIQVRLVLAKKSRQLRDDIGFEAAQQNIAEGDGKKAMDEIRVVIEKMEATGRGFLIDRRRQDRGNYVIGLVAGILTILLSLSLVGLAFDRVRRELAARREGRDRYRSVFDHMIHGIIIIDEDGMIESVNPATQRLFGYPEGEIVGQDVRMLTPEPFRSEFAQYLATLLLSGQERIIGLGQEAVGLRKDGSTFPIDLAVSTFRVGGRRLLTWIVRNMTARKQLEEELRQRAKELTEADHRKNEFLAMLAHELRNPLAPIANAIQILRHRCPKDADTLWAHDVVERQVHHMARMVDDLLDVSRITRGKINVHKEPMDVATAVTRAVEMAEPLIEARKHELTISLPPQPVWVEGDLSRLAQVLANLLNNAAKFTEEAGHIWLTVEPHEGEALIKVRDTGVGIPANYLPRVFDLFSQEDSTLERAHGGLGIGLTLVRILINLHGGAIQAFSPGAGHGSEFVARLPLLPEDKVPKTPAQVQPHAQQPAAQGPLRILVVDDNIDGARSLSMLLTASGYEVRTAHDGLTALEIARAWPPEVVLLDIGLPQMNGLEVARRLRQELGLNQALLIAMTGYGQDEDRQRSQDAGFNAHLVKPVDLDVLQTLLVQSQVRPALMP